jgi:CRISPR-associated exonuclease Cas4
MYILLATGLIATAVLLFWQSAKYKKSAGLPEGKVIYTDSHLWKRLDQILFDKSIALTGKPDYVVENGGEIIPVEIKSNIIKSRPYDSHILQLAAYCRLIETGFAKRPGYGVLHYPNRTYKIKYTDRLESQLMELVDSIRVKSGRGEGHRSHQSAAKCKGCGYTAICEERLI